MPPAQDPPSSITLRVKVPPGYLSSTTSAGAHSDEFPLGSIPTSITVGALRQKIQHFIPTHPAPELQRLLYGGRALVDNAQSVGDALNLRRDPAQTEYVIHLLVKGEGSRTPTPRPDVAPAREASTNGPSNTTFNGGQPTDSSLNGPSNPLSNGGQDVQLPPSSLPQPPGAPIPLQMPQAYPHNHPPPSQIPMTQQQLIQQHQHLTRLLAAQQQQQMLMQHMAQPQPQHLPIPVPTPMPGNLQQYNQAEGAPPAAGPNQTPEQTEQQQASQQPASLNATTPDQQQQAAQAQQANRIRRRGQGFIIDAHGPNGQHFQMYQHMLNVQPYAMAPPGNFMPPMLAPNQQFPIPGVPPNAMPMQAPVPGMMPTPPLAGAPPAQQPSRLDQARESVAAARRQLDDLRNSNTVTENERQIITLVQEQVRQLNDYIDPFPAITARQATSPHPPAPIGNMPLPQGTPTAPRVQLPPHLMYNLQNQMPLQGNTALPYAAPRVNQPTNPGSVTAYLLSSPQGPQALLFSPEHGTYTGAIPYPASPNHFSTALAQHPPIPLPGPPAVHANAFDPDPVLRAAQQHLAEGQNGVAAAAQDPLGPLQPLLGHVWLLLRILIFAYFLLGSGLGWQRPLILLAIGLGFWLVRMGVFGNGRPVRIWWEGLVGVPRPREAVVRDGDQVQAPGRDGAAQEVEAPANRNANANQLQRQRMPTPAQVAQRLLDEEATREQQQRHWLRERIRPVERAVALFVASLWPGIGEAHVRAREEEQRRQQEEEVAARRREEEEREKKSESPAASGEAKSAEVEKSGDSGPVAAVRDAGEGRA